MSHESISDLINIVVHDLKTPISSARGFIDLAKNTGTLDEKQRQYLERAMHALGRMEGMVSDMLEMARIDSKEQFDNAPCAMRVILTEVLPVLEDYADQREVSIHVDVGENLHTVWGEPALLNKVMFNLLGNAIKYNRRGGDVYVTIANDGDSVRVSIRDTGIGIPPDDVPHVFDRFYRSKLGKELRIEGTGLGLAIVNTIVERHHGHISVTSVLDEGSEFVMVLPGGLITSEGEQPVVHDGHNQMSEGSGRTMFDEPNASGEVPDSVDDNLQEARHSGADGESAET